MRDERVDSQVRDERVGQSSEEVLDERVGQSGV